MAIWTYSPTSCVQCASVLHIDCTFSNVGMPAQPQRLFSPLSSDTSSVTSSKINVLSQPCRGHCDLLLPLYVLNWTMYIWWTLCKVSVCHFDVWFFVLKMFMTMLSISNRWKNFQSSLRVFLLGYNPQFGLYKILFVLS